MRQTESCDEFLEAPLHTHLTRRSFLRHTAAITAGASLWSLPGAKPAAAQTPTQLVELVDTAEAFGHGIARGVAVTNGTLRATRSGGEFTSRVLRSGAPFTHVGIHWAASVPPQARIDFEVRTSLD